VESVTDNPRLMEGDVAGETILWTVVTPAITGAFGALAALLSGNRRVRSGIQASVQSAVQASVQAAVQTSVRAELNGAAKRIERIEKKLDERIDPMLVDVGTRVARLEGAWQQEHAGR
jgi:hypothetical protein